MKTIGNEKRTVTSKCFHKEHKSKKRQGQENYRKNWQYQEDSASGNV